MYLFVKTDLDEGEAPGVKIEALLVLIPKEDGATSIRNFRPVSLCNVVFKWITKILVKRLRNVWGEVIAPSQASFVPGLQSIDNVIICQEIIHTLKNTKAKQGGMVIKLDLEKAYDRLE